jgi:hypothetical protein
MLSIKRRVALCSLVVCTNASHLLLAPRWHVAEYTGAKEDVVFMGFRGAGGLAPQPVWDV